MGYLENILRDDRKLGDRMNQQHRFLQRKIDFISLEKTDFIRMWERIFNKLELKILNSNQVFIIPV